MTHPFVASFPQRARLLFLKILTFVGFGLLLAGVSATQDTRLVMVAVGVLALAVIGLWFCRFGGIVVATIFGIFMILTILFNRTFAHVAMPKPPFYITEVTMIGLSGLLWYRGELRIPWSIRPYLIGIAAVMVVGIVFNGSRFGILPVIRDSAELYYIWFVPLSYSVYRLIGPYVTRAQVELALVLSIWCVPLIYLATAHIQLSSTSESVSAMLILTIFIWEWRLVPQYLIWPALILNLVSLVHWGARGPWVGLGLGVAVLMAFGKNVPGDFTHRLRAKALITISLGLWLLGVVWMVDPPILVRISHDVLSLSTFHGSYNQVANNRWRLIIWEEAGKQIRSNPFAIRVGQPWIPQKLVALGYGGWNAVKGYAQNTVALSNSYLQMMQWYGIWAVIPVAVVVYQGSKGLLHSRPWTSVQVLVACFLAIWAVVTGVEVVLEGPYMSAIVWSLVGFGFYFPEWKALKKRGLT